MKEYQVRERSKPCYKVEVKRVGSPSQPTLFTGPGAQTVSLNFYQSEREKVGNLVRITREWGYLLEASQEFECHTQLQHYSLLEVLPNNGQR